jgi:hypothetical protein
MHEGRLLAIGTPAEVKQNPDPIIRRFLQADFKRQPQSL